ncbi:hypothetical protein BDP27DRAFT_1327544 [Rhodocollybia butyracea]|uniref:Uncharacterized protein n=1 Tax=Rhodocollybia butyracea TaxID=206335 RepID=A0A9P5U5W2_9AGAR|nr:hypothetical protein BDP27DRAFT_1327544 [Rhodocollybia butyracea]
MVDVISIVVAVVALLGTLAQAALTGWFSLHSEDKKRQDILRATFSKYHDPLHLAADDLSVKLINIISYGVAAGTTYATGPYEDPGAQGYSVMHTSFVFAQFFAWVNILRRDTEFLRPHAISGSAGADVMELLARIRSVLRSGYHARFQIATGVQSAMGEIATAPESSDGKGQLRCIGFVAFCEKWRSEPGFQAWFDPIVQGTRDLSSQTNAQNASDRLMILQHLLSDLINVLDPEHIHSYAKGHCEGNPPRCMCTKCATANLKAGEQGDLGKNLGFHFPEPFVQNMPLAEQWKIGGVSVNPPPRASTEKHMKHGPVFVAPNKVAFAESQALAELWKQGQSHHHQRDRSPSTAHRHHHRHHSGPPGAGPY